MALTTKQQAFVNAYLSCFNASEAARQAGYTERSAYATGWETLRKPEVAETIKRRLQETAMTADEVLMRLAEQARGLSGDYVQEDGSVDIARMVRDEKTHLLKRIRDTLHGRDYELYDAQSALKLIGEHYALFSGGPLGRGESVTADDAMWDEATEDNGQAKPIPPSAT